MVVGAYFWWSGTNFFAASGQAYPQTNTSKRHTARETNTPEQSQHAEQSAASSNKETMPSSSSKKNKRKRESNDGSEDTPLETAPSIIKEQGLELVSGLTFLNDGTTSTTDGLQYWLIKAPKNFDLKLLDGTKLKMAAGSSSKITSGGDSEYIVTNQGKGDNVQQIVGFAPTGSDGEMTCMPPFTREIHVVERFSQDTARKNMTLRGVKHQAYKAPAQIKLGYRLKCAGFTASSSSNSSSSNSNSEVVAKKLKKSKKSKKKKTSK